MSNHYQITFPGRWTIRTDQPTPVLESRGGGVARRKINEPGQRKHGSRSASHCITGG